METGHRLTAKQQAFCQEVLVARTASEAYRRVYNAGGMKPASVHRRVTELLDNGKVAARIAELQAETAEKLLVSDESALREFARVGFSDIRKLFTADGRLKPLAELDDDTAAAIKSFKVVSRRAPGSDAAEVEHVIEVRLWPKTQALDSLSKHLGLFERDNAQRGEHTVILHDPAATG